MRRVCIVKPEHAGLAAPQVALETLEDGHKNRSACMQRQRTDLHSEGAGRTQRRVSRLERGVHEKRRRGFWGDTASRHPVGMRVVDVSEVKRDAGGRERRGRRYGRKHGQADSRGGAVQEPGVVKRRVGVERPRQLRAACGQCHYEGSFAAVGRAE